MSALSVTVLLLGNLIEVFDLVTVIFTALLILIAREEIGYKSLGIYAVTLCLSVIIVPSKLIALEYGVMCMYPYIKPLFDKQGVAVKALLKLVYFLAGALALILVMKIFTPESPLYWDAIFLVGFLLVFFLYDVLLFRFVMYYRFRLRKKLRLDKFFNQK